MLCCLAGDSPFQDQPDDEANLGTTAFDSIYNSFTSFRLQPSGAAVCQLGDGMNLFKGQTTPTQVIEAPRFIDNNKSWIPYGGGTMADSYNVENNSTSLERFAGSLNFLANLKFSMEISLDARFAQEMKTETTQISKYFVSRTVTGYEHLDIGKLTPRHLLFEGSDIPTHICTEVYKGMSITGVMKLTKKATSSHSKAEMELMMNTIPFKKIAQGGGGFEFDKTELERNYTFSAQFVSTVSKHQPLFVTNIEQFHEVLSSFYTTEANQSPIDSRREPQNHDIMEYKFTPILMHRKFGPRLFPGRDIANEFYIRYSRASVNMKLTWELADKLLKDVTTAETGKNVHTLKPHKDKIRGLLVSISDLGRTTATKFQGAFTTGTGDATELLEQVKSMEELELSSLSTYRAEINKSRLFLMKFLNHPELGLPGDPINANGYYLIKSHHGTYLRILGDFNSWGWAREVDAVPNPDDMRCHFYIEKKSTNRWTLKANGNNLYLSARYTSLINGCYIDARPKMHSTESLFYIERNENGTFSFQGHYNKWIRCHTNGEVDDVDDKFSHEMFTCVKL